MPSSRKPTVVIVHGAWHDPSCFDLVCAPLESEGYKCHVPNMPSIGELAASKTSSDDADVVHAVIEACLARGEDVVVVGHSIGGLKANEALKGLVGPDARVGDDRGTVLRLGIIAGFLPPVGKMGASAGTPQAFVEPSRWVVHATEPTLLPRDPPNFFYNDMPPEQAAYWTSRIRPMHVDETPPTFYEAWRHVPASYLVCTKDNVLSEVQQDAVISDARAEGAVVSVTRVESGHSPFLSVPEQVAAWIKRMADGLA